MVSNPYFYKIMVVNSSSNIINQIFKLITHPLFKRQIHNLNT